MEQINLTLYNNSNETDNAEVVIFQKNVATNYDELVVAWKVIKNLGQTNYHPFTYSLEMQVSANDSYGNYTPNLVAYPGQMFEMVKNKTGDVLRNSGKSTSPNEVQVLNGLESGAIGASIYRDGRVLATKTAFAPEQKAVFEFKPTIWIGVASQIQEGQFMDSAVISNINTELSLLGIKSADIVWTGGGPGVTSMPYRFTLQNVKYG